VAENFPNLKSYPGAGSLQNPKPSGLKKKHTWTHPNQTTQYSEQRKNSENCKRKMPHIIANP
jgi:hypothetical protein